MTSKTFTAKQITRVGTWNIRTMMDPTALAQITNEMSRYRMEILGLCETRWNGNGEFQTNDGFTLLYSGRPEGEDHAEGVDILLSKTALKSLLTWNPISERIITARFNSTVRKITIIHCYAPTEVSRLEDKLEFYDQLTDICHAIPKGDILIVTGDFNSQIGSDNRGMEHVMGKHGIGTLTVNGELLLEFCNTFNLIIGGSFFPHKRIHKITWVSPDQKTENQIDHIMISKSWRRSLLDVRNHRGAEAGSDHYLITGCIQLKILANPNKLKEVKRISFNLRKLLAEETAERFSNLLSANAEKIKYSQDNLEENWSQTKSALMDTAQNVLGTRKRQYRKPWISDGTWKIIEERSKVKELLNTAKDFEEKQRLERRRCILNAFIKRSARHDKRKWKEDLANQAQLAADRKDSRELYRLTRKMASKNLTTNHPVKDKSGKIHASTDQQLSRWHEHFSELLSVDNDVNEHQTNQPTSPNIRPVRVSTDPPSQTEIASALKALKLNKAAGPDGIPAEILRADTTTTSKLLLPVMTQIWNSETLPKEWTHGLIVKIPKKGDLSKCDNWRGITLLNTCSKVLAKIVHERIAHTLESNMRPEQAGFRPHRSCVDQINTLRMIIEQSIEWRSNLYLVFIDFLKAFDKIKHSAIWRALKKNRIPNKIINIIKLFYRNNSSQVLHKGKLSEAIPIRAGVKQGCVLSALLFNIVLDEVMKSALDGNMGIRWSMTNHLEDLDYADDICLLSHSFNQMQTKLAKLVKEAEKVGLIINVKKTKSMRIFTNNEQNFNINDEPIEDVAHFTYLGSFISRNGGASEDAMARINKASHAFSLLRCTWNSTQYASSTKIRIFKSNIMPVLLYGCETWKTSKQITHRLQVFVNKCLRRILRIFWPNKISNEALWERTNTRPIDQEIKIRKWRWIGHTLRRGNNNITRMALDWTPQGSRRRGRPAENWRRLTLREVTESGKSWREVKTLARDRTKWRSYIEALCFK